MKGHETLIQLREAGRVPKCIFINDYPCPTDWFHYGEHATVCVAGDKISSIDLRFVHGVMVCISSVSESRAKSLFELAKQSGAVAVGYGSGKNSLVWHKEQAHG